MNVRMVSYSQSAKSEEYISEEEFASWNTDMQGLVAYCARVSNPSNQMNTETNERLLNYLIKHKHWSPFEMVSVCMEIETTRDIARQILRHRSFSFQEFSQRYSDVQEMADCFEFRYARMQDPKNRQNSIKATDAQLQTEWLMKQADLINKVKETYNWALDKGIAKEQARAVLPEGLTKSRMYMNGTLRSWIHYIELRRENGTQQEHMDIARECAKVISQIFPMEDKS